MVKISKLQLLSNVLCIQGGMLYNVLLVVDVNPQFDRLSTENQLVLNFITLIGINV